MGDNFTNKSHHTLEKIIKQEWQCKGMKKLIENKLKIMLFLLIYQLMCLWGWLYNELADPLYRVSYKT